MQSFFFRTVKYMKYDVRAFQCVRAFFFFKITSCTYLRMKIKLLHVYILYFFYVSKFYHEISLNYII